MNLLFLTPQLPHPPRQGTAIRNWGLIKSLSARHAITLLTFAGEDEPITPELEAACQRVETVSPPRRTRLHRLHDLFLSSLPDLAHRLASLAFTDRLTALLQTNRFDALFVEGLELAQHLLTNHQLPITIFDAHNCETALQRRAFETDLRRPRRWPAAFYSLIQSRRLARFEAQVCQRATHVTCVSAEDATALRGLVPALNPLIIPNGIFLADYTQLSNNPTTQQPSLVFTGKMDYRPNVDAVTWFAAEVFPLIRREAPEAEFVIVGQKPTPAVQKLGEAQGVVVTGAVEDARPYIGGATVYVAPLRMGGGTRFKLLEAMALRRAIVSTRLGAEGFAVKDGQEVCLADDAAGFARAVLMLIRSETKRAELGEAGYKFVENYDWGAIVPEVEKLFAGKS